MDTPMDPSTFFSGSSHFKYEPTDYLEASIGFSKFQSISAMIEYQNSSIEEIRLEDYKASGGFFGSAFAKLGGAVCVRPSLKMRPYYYGELYKAALKTLGTGVIYKHEDSKIGSLTAVPQNQIQKPNNINLSFHGKQNVKIFINCDSDVNFSFKGNMAAQSVLEIVQQSKVLERPTEPMHSPIHNPLDGRKVKNSTEKCHKSSHASKNGDNSKRRKH